MGEPTVDFAGPDELLQVCEMIRARLHSANRIAAGESGFVWEVAETFGRLGKVFVDGWDDPDIDPRFGTAYTEASLDRAARRRALAEMLFPELVEAN